MNRTFLVIYNTHGCKTIMDKGSRAPSCKSLIRLNRCSGHQTLYVCYTFSALPDHLAYQTYSPRGSLTPSQSSTPTSMRHSHTALQVYSAPSSFRSLTSISLSSTSLRSSRPHPSAPSPAGLNARKQHSRHSNLSVVFPTFTCRTLPSPFLSTRPFGGLATSPFPSAYLSGR